MVAFADVPLDHWRYTGAQPAIYRSSPHGERRFCGACGAQIEYRDAVDPVSVSVNVTTLDNPGLVTPGFHIWTDSALPWTRFDDGLPRYGRGKAAES